MEPNAFVGKKSKPTQSQLALTLGPSKAMWNQIVEELSKECPTQEWSSYSVKAGWSLKLKRKDRTILYLSPTVGGFRASFVLGDKAVRAASNAGLSRAVLTLINNAKKYAEGTGIRVDVAGAADVEDVKKLAAIKLAN